MTTRDKWRLYSSPLSGYMHRWILQSPRGTRRIHHILTSDEGRDFHDHPWHFRSVILKGRYLEHRPGCRCTVPLSAWGSVTLTQPIQSTVVSTPHPDGPCRWYGPGSVVTRAATDVHRLELAPGQTVWTYVRTGPYERRWGFQTAKGWVDYKDYDRSYYNL